MHHSARVSFGDGFGGLLKIAQQFGNRARRISHHFAQRFAIHEFHGDETGAGFLANFVDMSDIGVVHGSPGFRFLEKAAAEFGSGELVWKDLQRNIAVQTNVASPIDLAHTSRAEAFQNRIRPELGAAG